MSVPSISVATFNGDVFQAFDTFTLIPGGIRDIALRPNAGKSVGRAQAIVITAALFWEYSIYEDVVVGPGIGNNIVCMNRDSENLNFPGSTYLDPFIEDQGTLVQTLELFGTETGSGKDVIATVVSRNLLILKTDSTSIIRIKNTDTIDRQFQTSELYQVLR